MMLNHWTFFFVMQLDLFNLTRLVLLIFLHVEYNIYKHILLYVWGLLTFRDFFYKWTGRNHFIGFVLLMLSWCMISSVNDYANVQKYLFATTRLNVRILKRSHLCVTCNIWIHGYVKPEPSLLVIFTCWSKAACFFYHIMNFPLLSKSLLLTFHYNIMENTTYSSFALHKHPRSF